MTTLREHLEAIRDRHEDDEVGYLNPCPDRRDALAALAILDAAGTVSTPWFRLLDGPHRLVPDPEGVA